MRIIFQIVLIFALIHNELNCQEDGGGTSIRRPTKHARKKHRTKTTKASETVTETPLPATLPELTDEAGKPLSMSEEGNDDSEKLGNGSEGGSIDADNPHHHIASPFIYADEKLNQTHADMFKR